MTQSWLITTDPVSNGKPDCLGRAVPDTKPEHDIVVYRAIHGNIVTCWPVQTFALRPFGTLEPAADDGAKAAPTP